jgi:hypothetical protein
MTTKKRKIVSKLPIRMMPLSQVEQLKQMIMLYKKTQSEIGTYNIHEAM